MAVPIESHFGATAPSMQTIEYVTALAYLAPCDTARKNAAHAASEGASTGASSAGTLPAQGTYFNPKGFLKHDPLLQQATIGLVD
jgi:hypothetical protein